MKMIIESRKLVGFPSFIELIEVLECLQSTERYLTQGYEYYNANISKLDRNEETLEASFEVLGKLYEAFDKGIKEGNAESGLFIKSDGITMNAKPLIDYLSSYVPEGLLQVLYYIQNYMRDFLHTGNILDYKRLGDFVHRLYLDLNILSS